ncbi:MAG: hypothetical protein ACRD52_16025 [Candidatus Acidiferrales bacterium]
MTAYRNSKVSPGRLLIVVSLLLALLSIMAASSIAHIHADAESAATCRICQVGHAPLAPTAVRVILPRPFVTIRTAFAQDAVTYRAPLASHSHSRGPPA